MLSASSLERVESCPASEALPHAPYAGEAAETGTENHRVIEEVINAGGIPDALADLFAGAEQVHTEIAYVIDVVARTSRRIGKLAAARDYGKLGATEVAMTLDVEIVHADRIAVIDWKSRSRVTPAERNLQILAQMCAVESHYGLSGVAGLVYLDNMERDMAPFSLLDSGARWSRLARIVERAGKGTPSAGSHCRYCPALLACPTQKAALTTFMGAELADDLPVERLGEIWVELQALEAKAEQVRKAIQLRARREPVPLPSGKLLRLVESSRSSYDAKAMAAELSSRGVDPEQFKRVSYFDKVTETKGK